MAYSPRKYRLGAGFIQSVKFCLVCGNEFPKTNSHRDICYNCIYRGKHLGLEKDNKKYWLKNLRKEQSMFP